MLTLSQHITFPALPDWTVAQMRSGKTGNAELCCKSNVRQLVCCHCNVLSLINKPMAWVLQTAQAYVAWLKPESRVVLQRLLKQGVEGLSKAQYQLLYVQPGLMKSSEKADWDIMTAVETF